MIIDREVINARVRLFLEGGCTYNEALRRAYLQTPGFPVQHVMHIDGRPIGSVAS